MQLRLPDAHQELGVSARGPFRPALDLSAFHPGVVIPIGSYAPFPAVAVHCDNWHGSLRVGHDPERWRAAGFFFAISPTVCQLSPVSCSPIAALVIGVDHKPVRAVM